MTGIPDDEKALNIRAVLGVGLDGDPAEKRITRGETFYLFGGSKETHEQMFEHTVKFNEKVGTRGKKLEQINARELVEIVRELAEEF